MKERELNEAIQKFLNEDENSFGKAIKDIKSLLGPQGEEFKISGKISGWEGYDEENSSYVVRTYEGYVSIEKEETWYWAIFTKVNSDYEWDYITKKEEGFNSVDECLQSFKNFIEESYDSLEVEGIAR